MGVLRAFANILAILFHPVFFVVYMLIVYYTINPYLFSGNDYKTNVLIFVSILSLTVIFPLICIALMSTLGLISGLKMESNKDRVGPMIASGIFYIWLYVNVKSNPNIPDIFTAFLLGSTIALFVCFFINNFTKISLHSAAVGGMLCGMFLLKFGYDYYSFLINIKGMGSYIVSTDLLILFALLLAGLMGTSRLLIKAHTTDQVFGGYLVGIFSQLIAYQIVG